MITVFVVLIFAAAIITIVLAMLGSPRPQAAKTESKNQAKTKSKGEI